MAQCNDPKRYSRYSKGDLLAAKTLQKRQIMGHSIKPSVMIPRGIRGILGGTSLPPKLCRKDGSCATVIAGRLILTSGDAVEHLSEGDTARYAADVGHKISAVGSARAFLVVHGA